MDNTICGSFAIVRECGCTESVWYSGMRDGKSIDIFEKKQKEEYCTTCYEAKTKEFLGGW